ncbi:MAG: hypothetical protein AAF170_07815 [Bacteroidota bacterium]
MPLYIFDPDIWQDWMNPGAEEPLPPPPEARVDDDGNILVYEAANAAFSRSDASGLEAIVWDELAEIGATQLQCRYDGGYDELFVTIESALVGDEALLLPALLSHLAPGRLGNRVETLVPEWAHLAQHFASWSREARAEYALDTFGGWLTSFMGVNGTGDMGVRGAFVTDLGAGTLSDIPPQG